MKGSREDVRKERERERNGEGGETVIYQTLVNYNVVLQPSGLGCSPLYSYLQLCTDPRADR